MRATRALIHLDHLKENIALVTEKTGRAICMPLKAGAYGHGALELAGAALAAGVTYLAVATVGEGTELRQGGIEAPVLLLSIPLPEEIKELAASDMEPLAGDGEYIDALDHEAARTGKRIRVHLKIDTGMGRIGCSPAMAPALASRITKSKNLMLAGTATHLAVSDSLAPKDRAFTNRQLEVFSAAVEAIKALGVDPGLVHAANTGAVTFYSGAWFDMVRPGILLYGYAPKDKTGKAAVPVKPLMELVSSLVFIKPVARGTTVSYGRIWKARTGTVIGTIPIGYADGLPRGLGNTWRILAGGVLRPLAGRICMDQCMVDLGRDSGLRRWDRVTIFGGKAPHAGVMASLLGTIPYEITCNINKRVPRIYIDKN
ncbi:MAG: alanine racemase [Spirochaetaceae bacterium]|jgi:alanine racemase|nr:alanine racemase [Spirochaetaceae bacterium]